MKPKFNKTIKLPGSKSIANRALICSALANGATTLYNFPKCDDTTVLVNSLKKLGFKISIKNSTLKIDGGISKIRKSEQKFYTKNAGTTTRFITAFLCLLNGNFSLSVNKKMSQRPIKDLVESLKQLGGNIKYLKKTGFPPLQIFKSKKAIGGKTCIRGNLSSQYLSALLLTLPYAKKDVEIIVQNKLTSLPYIKTTLAVIKSFGGKIHVSKDFRKFHIKANQKYKPQKYLIEADTTSATYFQAITFLHNSKITIKNLPKNSIQGDIAFLKVINKMKGGKTLKPLGKIDLNEIPDAAMTIAILACFAKGKSILTGLDNLRIKECDRLHALATELKKTGVDIKELKSGLIINGDPKKLHGAEIETYNDNRIAMCFGVMGTLVPGIKIKNPNCVKKSYPNFWKDLQSIYE